MDPENPHFELTRESMIRLPEVRRHTGLGTTTIYNLVKAGKFPRQYKLTAYTSAWKWGDVLDWLESRAPDSDGERGAA